MGFDGKQTVLVQAAVIKLPLTRWRKQQVFIFSPFGRLEVQGRVACKSGLVRASWFADGCHLAVSSHGRVQRTETSSFLSCKGTKAIMRAPHSWPIDLPKVPSLDTMHWGLRFQHMGLGVRGAGHRYSVHSIDFETQLCA